jgi:hypothetical protein
MKDYSFLRKAGEPANAADRDEERRGLLSRGADEDRPYALLGNNGDRECLDNMLNISRLIA